MIRGKVCDFGTTNLRMVPYTPGAARTHVAGIPKER
jgi:hypothetical protein